MSSFLLTDSCSVFLFINTSGNQHKSCHSLCIIRFKNYFFNDSLICCYLCLIVYLVTDAHAHDSQATRPDNGLIAVGKVLHNNFQVVQGGCTFKAFEILNLQIRPGKQCHCRWMAVSESWQTRFPLCHTAFISKTMFKMLSLFTDSSSTKLQDLSY